MASPFNFNTSHYQEQPYLHQLMSLNGKVPSRNGEMPPQVSQDGVSMLRFPNYISFSSEAEGDIIKSNSSFPPLELVTPDKFNRAQGGQNIDDTDTGNYRITGERGLKMNNTSFSERDPTQTCFDQGTEATGYFSSIRFYTHLESQKQIKDRNTSAYGIKANFIPFAPVTPHKWKAAEVGHTSEVIDLVDDGEIVGNKEQESVSFQTRMKPIQICSDRDASTEVQLQLPLSDDPPQQMENHILRNEENNGINMDKTPHQGPRRKKHRPKVIKEGESARKARHATPKSVDTSETPRVKRKYVRKKGIINSSDTPETGFQEKDSVSKTETRKSVKRALNFDSEEVQIIDGLDATTVSYKGSTESNYITESSNDCSNSNNDIQNVTEKVDKATLSASNVSFDLNCSGNQLPDKSVKFQEDCVTTREFSRRIIIRENLKSLSRQRNRIEITNHSDIAMPSGLQNCQLSLESMHNSNSFLNPQFASDNISNQVAHVNFDFTRDKATSCGKNVISQNADSGKIYKDMNFVSGYQWTYTNLVNRLSALQNKKRAENGKKDLMPNISSEVPPTSSNYMQNLIDSRKEEFSFADTQMAYNKLKAAEHVPGHTERKRRKLPEAIKQASKFASLRVIFRCGQQPSALKNQLNNNQIQESAKIRVVNEVGHSKVIPKRQRKKRAPLNFNNMPSHSDSQPKASVLLREPAEFVAFPKGNFQQNKPHNLQSNYLHNSLSWRDYDNTLQSSTFYEGNVPYIDAIDLLVQKMKILFIRDGPEECTYLGVEQQNALVPYNGGGMIVPFEGLLDTSKKRRSRAKVDLDSETNRVWMLLMGKEASEELGEGVDNEKRWEEERRVFRGRVDSFIARMHLVQGDRRFSRWKGSVVDSVVGVFLTQNVSDHLSSSAFMSVAARFPFRSRSKKSDLDSEKTNTLAEREALSSPDFNDKIGGELKIPNQFDADHCSEKCNEISCTQENKIAEGSQTVGQLEECAASILSRGTAFKACGGEENADTRLQGDIISSSLQGVDFEEREDAKLQESLHSSQGSVISSENSSESPVHTIDQIRLNSETSSKTESVLARDGWNHMDSSTPFMELLRMAGNNMLHDLSSRRKEIATPSSTNSLISFGLEKREPIVDNPSSFHDSNQSMGTFNSCDITGQHDFFGMSGSFSLYNSDSIPNSCSTSNSFAKNTCQMSSHEKSLLNSYGHLVGESYVSHSKPPIQPVSYPLNDNFFDNQSWNHNYSSKENDTNTGKQQQIGVQCELQRSVKGGNENIIQTFEQKIHEQNTDSTQHVTVERSTRLPTTTKNGTSIFHKTSELKFKADTYINAEVSTEIEKSSVRRVKVKVEKEQKDAFDWDSLRKEALCNNTKKERSCDTMDSVDWEAVRTVDLKEVSNTIRERGMNNKLAQRIQDFLNRIVREHGSIDLEWLRDVPPDKAKDYLLSIPGLGLKSVECVRLLTLHHLAFPVDTNVGRICVRLGWVPLQPLPESLQLHLLELYPLLETIQKYLWPRLCTLDQRTLYELHYQLITFGKVFCTKSKPNCNACPMRGECRHFASAFASARLALPGPEEKSIISSKNPIVSEGYHEPAISPMPLPQIEGNNVEEPLLKNSEPIIEEPATPEPECVNSPENEIEDFYEDPDEIPTIKLNIEQFTQNLQSIMQGNNNSDIQDVDMSKALVALNTEAASIPQPKLKNISRLRTEHQVYELPDSHPLLEGLEQREADDPSPYLLAIWTPGETAQSMEPPEDSCSFQDKGVLCDRSTCFACNSIRETQAHKVRGTILIPCRTAIRGSFPLNGTYFQVNEVFADHRSSLNPIDVPREWIWNLPRRTVYFGTSVTSIFKGLTTEGIQHCFWRGFICVRGFDQETRAPRPLLARLHFSASKVIRNKTMPIK